MRAVISCRPCRRHKRSTSNPMLVQSGSEYTPHWVDKTVDLPNDNYSTMGPAMRGRPVEIEACLFGGRH